MSQEEDVLLLFFFSSFCNAVKEGGFGVRRVPFLGEIKSNLFKDVPSAGRMLGNRAGG